MLDRIRARGFSIRLTELGALEAKGDMSPAQRKYLADHEAELVAALWQENSMVTCPRCQRLYNCREDKDARYCLSGEILCGACIGTVGNSWGWNGQSADVEEGKKA